MEIKRSFGVLLHPTSLPGPFSIGVLGQEARGFIDWLVASGASFWQVLPLNPVGPFNSPYQAISAFAGNPLLIDPRPLVEQGWLEPDSLPARGAYPTVDYAWVQKHFPRPSWVAGRHALTSLSSVKVRGLPITHFLSACANGIRIQSGIAGQPS